jgi:hypothetical protein
MKHRNTISLDALLSVLSERIHDAGGYTAFARLHGLTHGHWNNVANRRRPPNAPVLKVLGYEEIPPRFRPVKNKSK